MENLLDFYYGSESEQFTFYRIPKLLFMDKRFSNISSDAKILYGLLLDRMSLSMKNGWLDSENKVYIYFTIEEAMEALNIGRGKCIKTFSELDSEKGCGLIQRRKQGLGKPAIIYVMKFVFGGKLSSEIVDNNYKETDETINYESEIRTSGGFEETDFLKFENRTSGGTEKSNFLKSENRTSGNPKIETQEVGKSNANNTDINNNDYSNTESVISYPILSYQKENSTDI